MLNDHGLQLKGGANDPALFAKTVSINLNGTFNVLTAWVALMATQEPVEDTAGRGVIINTASIAAYEGQIGQIAYAASKGGVVALTLPAARDLASLGIRVNTIAPGIVDTPLMAGITEEFREELAQNVPFLQRLAAPAEYADLAVFIAEYDYINSETIRMGGAEAFVLGERLGLDAQVLYDVISTSSGYCWAVNVNCPVPGPVPGSPANRDYEPGFATALMSKDMGLAVATLDTAGVNGELGKRAADIYTHLVEEGRGTKDFSDVINAIREADGSPVSGI